MLEWGMKKNCEMMSNEFGKNYQIFVRKPHTLDYYENWRRDDEPVFKRTGFIYSLNFFSIFIKIYIELFLWMQKTNVTMKMGDDEPVVRVTGSKMNRFHFINISVFL